MGCLGMGMRKREGNGVYELSWEKQKLKTVDVT
jgi:hypothetical protein